MCSKNHLAHPWRSRHFGFSIHIAFFKGCEIPIDVKICLSLHTNIFFYSLHSLIGAKSKFIWAFIKPKRGGVVRTLSLPPTVNKFCPQTSVNKLPSTFGPSRYSFTACACVRMNELKRRLISGVCNRRQLLGVPGRFVNTCSFELRLSRLSWIEQHGHKRNSHSPCY